MPADPVVSPADTIQFCGSINREHCIQASGLCEVHALLAVGERDRRQIARLTEALAFYADPVSYENETPRHVRPVSTDGGSRARAVLAGEEDARP